MKHTQKIVSALAFVLLFLQAATAGAAVYVSTTQADGVIGASPWSDDMAVHLTMHGEFTVNYPGSGSVNAFFNTDWSTTEMFFFTQWSKGTTSYDSATQLYTLSDASVRISQRLSCGTNCSYMDTYWGTMNLAFYVLGSGPNDILYVPGANFITINQVVLNNGHGGDLYSPSRIDLTYQGTVPLPATAWLLASGLCGLMYSKRKAGAIGA